MKHSTCITSFGPININHLHWTKVSTQLTDKGNYQFNFQNHSLTIMNKNLQEGFFDFLFKSQITTFIRL